MLELKKSLTKAVLLLCVVLVFAALSGCGKEQPVLNVYNWGDYIDENVLQLFEEQTGIKVVYSTFEMNEDMYTKIKSSQGDSYDVIIPSDYMIIKMKNEGMLAKIDHSKLSNYKLIDKKFENNTYDKGNEYSVPYMWGTVGIVYNKEMVKDPVDS
jgi:spermidine/putrescine transport system substrate-binding protein